MNHQQLLDHNMQMWYKGGVDGNWKGFRITSEVYYGKNHPYTNFQEITHKEGRKWIAVDNNGFGDTYAYTEKELYHKFVQQFMSERADNVGFWARIRDDA